MRAKRIFVGIAAIGCIMFGFAAAVPKDDRPLLQGRWERKIEGESTPRGAAKAVKEIAGERETVTYMDGTGQAIYATSADFKIETAGRVKLYTFSNFKVTKARTRAATRRRKPSHTSTALKSTFTTKPTACSSTRRRGRSRRSSFGSG